MTGITCFTVRQVSGLHQDSVIGALPTGMNIKAADMTLDAVMWFYTIIDIDG